MGLLYFVVFVIPVDVVVIAVALPPPPPSSLPSPVNALSALLLFLAFNSLLNRKSTVRMDMHGIDVLVVAGAL